MYAMRNEGGSCDQAMLLESYRNVGLERYWWLGE